MKEEYENTQDDPFRACVVRGVDALPDRIRSRLSNVALVVEDEPTPEQRRLFGLDEHHTLFGLYEGVPQTERGSGYFALPDKITIFRRPIEQAASDENEVERLVTTTVWHEVAHHFGMDEEQVRIEEHKRGYDV